MLNEHLAERASLRAGHPLDHQIERARSHPDRSWKGEEVAGRMIRRKPACPWRHVGGEERNARMQWWILPGPSRPWMILGEFRQNKSWSVVHDWTSSRRSSE